MDAWTAREKRKEAKLKEAKKAQAKKDDFDAALQAFQTMSDDEDLFSDSDANSGSSLGLELSPAKEDDSPQAEVAPAGVRGMFSSLTQTVSSLLQKRKEQSLTTQENRNVEHFRRRSLQFWAQHKQSAEVKSLDTDELDWMKGVRRNKMKTATNDDSNKSLPVELLELPLDFDEKFGNDSKEYSQVTFGDNSYLADLQHQKEKREMVRIEETMEDALELYNLVLSERGKREDEALYHRIFHKLVKERAPGEKEADRIQDQRIEREIERKKSNELEELLEMQDATKALEEAKISE